LIRDLKRQANSLRVISSVWQVKVLKEMRKASTESNEMKESFAATVQGIAAGMGWTG